MGHINHTQKVGHSPEDRAWNANEGMDALRRLQQTPQKSLVSGFISCRQIGFSLQLLQRILLCVGLSVLAKIAAYPFEI